MAVLSLSGARTTYLVKWFIHTNKYLEPYGFEEAVINQYKLYPKETLVRGIVTWGLDL